jgi:hypothetical protein
VPYVPEQVDPIYAPVEVVDIVEEVSHVNTALDQMQVTENNLTGTTE